MKSDIKKCPYCEDSYPKSKLNAHLEYDHADKLRASLARLKVALPIILIAFSFVCGMIYMGLIN